MRQSPFAALRPFVLINQPLPYPGQICVILVNGGVNRSEIDCEPKQTCQLLYKNLLLAFAHR